MIYRLEKGLPLTYQEHDDNFRELSNSIAAIESNSVILSSQISCTPISGLTYAVRADRYNIGGFYYKAAPINITLLTADNTYDRLDIIYADVFGNIGKITGTPGAVISTPDFDPEKQFLIKFILVKAGATVGTDPQTNIDLTKEQIYLNGIQNNWLLTTSNDVISESIVPVSITGVETILGDYFMLNNPTPIIVGNYDSLVFDFQNTSGKVYFNIRFFKNGIDFFVGAKTIKSGVFGFTSQNYQLQKIVIPLVEFNFSTTDFNKIEIEVVGPNSAWYFNNIHLTTGTNIVFQPTPITASEVKVLYESNTNTNPFTDADKTNLDLSKTHAESPHIQQSDVNTAETNAKSYADGLITQLIDGAPADGNTLKELNDKILAVQAIIGGTTADGDALVNTVAELLAVFSTYTEGVDLVTLLAGKVNTTDIYNALDCIVAGKVLDARQGKALKDLIDALTTEVSGKEDTSNKSQDIETDKASTTKYGSVKAFYDWAVGKFQAILVSGTNIKTINSTSLLGSGDIVIGSSTLGIVTVATTPYTFLLTDAQKKVIFTSATAVSATIPTNAVTPIPIGSKIEVTQSGAGIVTLVTTGLTISSASTTPITLVQGQTVYLVKTAINSWTIDLNIGASGAQTVSGLKTFLQDTLGLRNAANTFTSFFRNSNTAQRIYTLPNKDGTVAMTSDIIAQMNGVVNYLVKFGTTTTGVVSRLFDNGTFFGIGTVNTPTKDITLGNQANREIGVELSDSINKGRDLILSAGKTINYQLSANFTNLNVAVRAWFGITILPNGNVYACVNGGDIYMQTNGTGNFIALGQTNRPWYALASTSNNNVYAIEGDPGNIYMQTNGTGNFISLGQSLRVWRGVSVAPNGNVYACVNGGDIYMQTNGTGNFIALGQTTREWRGISVAPNGNVYATVQNGDIYMQTNGIGNFIPLGQTTRAWLSITACLNGNVYATVQNGDIYMQTNGTGNFVALGQTSRYWSGLASNSLNDLYATVFNDNLYFYQNNVLGIDNLDGGTLKHKAGTGKGTGKSRLEFITGQKTVSGTNMQIETLREYIDENGHHVYMSMPIYADNADAIAGGLVVGTQYRTSTGDLKIVY